jgi:hypothetical protein
MKQNHYFYRNRTNKKQNYNKEHDIRTTPSHTWAVSYREEKDMHSKITNTGTFK